MVLGPTYDSFTDLKVTGNVFALPSNLEGKTFLYNNIDSML